MITINGTSYDRARVTRDEFVKDIQVDRAVFSSTPFTFGTGEISAAYVTVVITLRLDEHNSSTLHDAINTLLADAAAASSIVWDGHARSVTGLTGEASIVPSETGYSVTLTFAASAADWDDGDGDFIEPTSDYALGYFGSEVAVCTRLPGESFITSRYPRNTPNGLVWVGDAGVTRQPLTMTFRAPRNGVCADEWFTAMLLTDIIKDAQTISLDKRTVSILGTTRVARRYDNGIYIDATFIPAGSIYPLPPSYVLQENGDYALQENGERILVY